MWSGSRSACLLLLTAYSNGRLKLRSFARRCLSSSAEKTEKGQGANLASLGTGDAGTHSAGQRLHRRGTVRSLGATGPLARVGPLPRLSSAGPLSHSLPLRQISCSVWQHIWGWSQSWPPAPMHWAKGRPSCPIPLVPAFLLPQQRVRSPNPILYRPILTSHTGSNVQSLSCIGGTEGAGKSLQGAVPPPPPCRRRRQ